MSEEEYTLIVGGERLTLTRDQLESEPGNYFATSLLGDFKDAADANKEMTLHRDPSLFRIIQNHLRGYVVLPIPNACVPPYMTMATTLQNLLREAEHFGLMNLLDLVKTEIRKQATHDVVRTSTAPQRAYRITGHRNARKDFSELMSIPAEVAGQYITTAVKPPYCHSCTIPPLAPWEFVTCVAPGRGGQFETSGHHLVLESREL